MIPPHTQLRPLDPTSTETLLVHQTDLHAAGGAELLWPAEEDTSPGANDSLATPGDKGRQKLETPKLGDKSSSNAHASKN